MPTQRKSILAQALELPEHERSALVERLLLSLERTDSEIDAAWAKEAEWRLAAYENGEIESVPISDIAEFQAAIVSEGE
ncbi:addiction module protein [Parahaliea maris]|uniref:Addiction module protein n=1 Tax=Parahaliea maris TaxID=2716870 RepID=A0A5C8ZQR0_9GAMM|nr:addiction module protein [Parahaliea maris]TXS90833.1 addiction module protein [Parahaliea maris]